MYYLLKTEASTYSFADLQRDGSTIWDGVTNPVAVRNLREMPKGAKLIIYHTGDEKAIVGHAVVAAAPSADPNNAKLAVVKISAGARLARPVTLAQLRAEASLKELALVRAPRLSVVPATAAQWKKLLQLAGEAG